MEDYAVAAMECNKTVVMPMDRRVDWRGLIRTCLRLLMRRACAGRRVGRTTCIGMDELAMLRARYMPDRQEVSEAGKLPGATKNGQRERGEALEAKSSFAGRQVADRGHSSPMGNGNGTACLRVKHFRWKLGDLHHPDGAANQRVACIKRGAKKPLPPTAASALVESTLKVLSS